MKTKRFLAVLLSLAMFIGMLPMSAFASYELGTSLDVSAEGKMYSLFTGNYLHNEHLGMTFLYVVERDGHYYTMSNPHYTERTEVDSVAAIDITEYYDSDTNTFSGIEDSSNIGVMQFQQDDYHKQYGLYLDGNMALKFSEPWEPSGKEWFDNGIHYYPAENYDGSGPSWQAKGDGSGYLYEISYGTGYGPIAYGVLDLKAKDESGTDTTEYVFSLRDKSDEYNELIKDKNNSDVVSGVTAYLYAAPCGHERGGDYAAYDAPTCMEKGCEEYWYCRLCETYFSDQKMTKAYEVFPTIPALGHDWDGEKCNNCGRLVPVYRKVTNKADFFALADDTMYVLVAEYEGKYYTPDTDKLYLYAYDRDGDGYADIYNVDENNNGTPDILEIDWDKNGVYDYLEDCETEEERKDYFEMLCRQYLTNLIYAQAVSLPVKEITLNADGTISHDAVKDALEFEMIKRHTREEIDQYMKDGMTKDILRYTYECVMQFAIPNTFIGSPCFIPSDRKYGERIQDPAFDTYYWSVLFYDDRESYPTQDWQTGEYSDTLEFLDICKEGSLALCQSWSSFYPESGASMECLRLRDYNGELSFVVGNNAALEGSEYVNDGAGGYYDSHDKQACVYLYASAPYEASHTCDFGAWVDDMVTDTHTRTCKDPECGKSETKPHDWDDGIQNDTPTCTEGATVTYTCTDCNKTKTETVDHLGHDWSEWTDDGENAPNDTHSRTCKREGCDAAESESHGWSRWVKMDDKTHKKSCFICEGTRTAAHNLDAGVVTKEATHLETGVKTFTCTDLCGYSYTEDIPKTTEHEWSEWLNNNNDGTHTRYCRCGANETEDCTYDEGVVTKEASQFEEGEKLYTCTKCGGTKTETIAKTTEVELPAQDKINSFVTCMYQQCLSRDPDQAGLEGWAEQLESGQMNGAQIAEAFVFSNEMLNKNLSNEEFVKVLYRSMMGREADEEGLAGWVSQLQGGFISRSEVMKAFVESAEFTAICESYGIIRGDYVAVGDIERFVTGFYTKCLGRPADAAGHWGWVKQLQQKNLNGAQIAEAFFFSEEFVSKNVSDEVYIATLYRTILGREADAEGLAGWVGQLQSSQMTRREILGAFIESDEFTKLCAGYGIERGSL